MTKHGGSELLFPGVEDPHRSAPEVPGQCNGRGLCLKPSLATEVTSDIRSAHNPDVVQRELQGHGNLPSGAVRGIVISPEGEPAIRGHHADGSMGLNRTFLRHLYF